MDKKNILLCVTGGIAVFKAAALTSKLTQSGFDVKVIMSASAQKFVTALTFQSLSRNPVYTDTFDEKDPGGIAHIDLADWADIILIAPATANAIGKLAHGIADDMFTTTLLASTAPVWIAPAMNVHMYDHPAVKQNMDTLHRYGYQFIEPQAGYLACGYVGKGRLEEPETIVELLKQYFMDKDKPLKGKKVLITAGPTQESVDPVRYFTNHSSGKMGYALAERASHLGAEVLLVSGPTKIQAPHFIKVVNVISAEEMFEAVMREYHNCDIVIKAAAVADYRPKVQIDQKMKKKDESLTIEMERTVDILKTLGEKKEHQLLIGFAAETEQVEKYAKKKLETKNADMIIANNVKQEGAGFGVDTNVVTIYKKDGSTVDLPLLTKNEIALGILEEVVSLIKGSLS